MKKYVKIIDNKTKLCEVGFGTDVEFYKSIGMFEADVEQGYDGNWYLAGYAPRQSMELIQHDLSEEVYKAKSEKAFGGVTVKRKKQEFIFETSKDSIALANSMFTSLQSKSEDYIIGWKTWKSADALMPDYVELTKEEFIKIYNFVSEMIEQSFALEAKLNSEIMNLSEDNLYNSEYLEKVKQYIKESFNKIKTVIKL